MVCCEEERKKLKGEGMGSDSVSVDGQHLAPNNSAKGWRNDPPYQPRVLFGASHHCSRVSGSKPE